MQLIRKQVCIGAGLAVAICIVPSAHAGSIARLAASLPDIGAPPSGEVQWVARSMRMNGVPMTLKTVRSRLGPQDLFSFYESRIRGQARSEFRRFSQGEWQLLAIKSSHCYITIEARPTIEGSEGTIAVTAIPGAEMARTSSDFPRPLTTRILSLQEYDDAGIESEHISLSSSRSVTLETRAFVHELKRDGWQVVRQPALETARGAVIEAQHGAQQAFITLLPDHIQPSMTAIVVIWRKS